MKGESPPDCTMALRKSCNGPVLYSSKTGTEELMPPGDWVGPFLVDNISQCINLANGEQLDCCEHLQIDEDTNTNCIVTLPVGNDYMEIL